MGTSYIAADENRLTGYFCWDTFFNLSNSVLRIMKSGPGEGFRFCTLTEKK